MDRQLIVPPLIAFSERFHRALGDGHHVASPLGAWMLLALSATATSGPDRDACAQVLGMDVDQAAALAGRLLEAPPAAIASAAALWTWERFDTPALREWRSRQPTSVVRGEMPSQAEADEWARQATLGLIKQFPATIDSMTALVLATALAAKSSWTEPYRVVPGKHLARPRALEWLRRPDAGAWGSRVQQALCSSGHSHQRILRSARAGDVAVHQAWTESGLGVTSVIAKAKVPPSEVLGVALRIATSTGSGDDVRPVSLFDLPLGHDELWSIEEESSPSPGRHEHLVSFLPAWKAHSTHDLLAMPLEMGTAARAVGALLSEPPLATSARQVAVARYTRTGFEAAAVSMMLELGSSMFGMKTEPLGIERRATLRFGHPYAVVAVVEGSGNRTVGLGDLAARAFWQGLPVFSAWVAEPGEAKSDPDAEEVDWD